MWVGQLKLNLGFAVLENLKIPVLFHAAKLDFAAGSNLKFETQMPTLGFIFHLKFNSQISNLQNLKFEGHAVCEYFICLQGGVLGN